MRVLRWPIRDRKRAWGGNFPSCVKEGDFTLYQNVTQPYCTGGTIFSVPFAAVDTHGNPDWTMTFDDQPAFSSLEVAQLAGVKRLLKENGFKIGAIDSRPDKATEIALNDFRKEMHFSARDGNAELFAALEKQTSKRGEAPQGFTLCNDGKLDVVTAIAEVVDGSARSRGWWQVTAGACARLITTPLHETAVWLLVDRPGGPTLVSGPDPFCVSPRQFEIRGHAQCVQHGFTEAGFLRMPLGGADGRVVRVGANGIEVQAAISK
jgi:uncharacterized membrane protein